MERSKIVAIITGAISIILAIAYLILVQFLDFRGEIKPAPISQLNQPVIISYHHPTSDTNRQIVPNLL
ncbi:MAG: hypothetical protein KME22_06145 [Hassallia sp. WJT32-NPBG1]|jgi:hypothetical protein|nr:hypothetical protein [Hassallia sp. WJT32-NPBG1]